MGISGIKIVLTFLHFFDVNLQNLKSLETCAIYSKIFVGVSFSGNLSKWAETSLQGRCRTLPPKKKYTGEQGDPNTANVGAQARSDKEKNLLPGCPQRLSGAEITPALETAFNLINLIAFEVQGTRNGH